MELNVIGDAEYIIEGTNHATSLLRSLILFIVEKGDKGLVCREHELTMSHYYETQWPYARHVLVKLELRFAFRQNRVLLRFSASTTTGAAVETAVSNIQSILTQLETELQRLKQESNNAVTL